MKHNSGDLAAREQGPEGMPRLVRCLHPEPRAEQRGNDEDGLMDICEIPRLQGGRSHGPHLIVPKGTSQLKITRSAFPIVRCSTVLADGSGTIDSFDGTSLWWYCLSGTAMDHDPQTDLRSTMRLGGSPTAAGGPQVSQQGSQQIIYWRCSPFLSYRAAGKRSADDSFHSFGWRG